MGKFLILGAGSPSDPSYEDVLKGMQTGDVVIPRPTIIESCHGCPDLMTKYSSQIQYLAEQGHRIVEILEGGLYFALPSIKATQVTVPVISCPLDIPAYQAFIVPPGPAAVVTTAIERKRAIPPETEKKYGTLQRKKAVNLGIKMLNLEEDTVVIEGDENPEKLISELNKFGIETSDEGKLVLTYGTRPLNSIGDESIQIWADSREGLLSGSYVVDTETTLANTPNTLQARDTKNLAIYAAKIISLQRPELIGELKKIAVKKRESYEERNILEELILK